MGIVVRTALFLAEHIAATVPIKVANMQISPVTLEKEMLMQGDAGKAKVAVTSGYEYFSSSMGIVVPTALFLAEDIAATVPIKVGDV